MKKSILGIFAILCFVWACGGGESEKLVDVNLLPFGMPLTIKAPADTIIIANQDDFLGMNDIIIKSRDTSSSYCLQIYLDKENNISDVSQIIQTMKTNIEADSVNTFIRYVEEDDNGFIYEYKTDDVSGFDFRYVMLRGITNKYTFQGGFAEETLTEDAVRMMYKVVQQ